MTLNAFWRSSKLFLYPKPRVPGPGVRKDFKGRGYRHTCQTCTHCLVLPQGSAPHAPAVALAGHGKMCTAPSKTMGSGCPHLDSQGYPGEPQSPSRKLVGVRATRKSSIGVVPRGAKAQGISLDLILIEPLAINSSPGE